mmetsp:Transcript_75364/g.243783  ORF Transcript_75364/g.243783 Transcript_75364/m.243783 type:complete len:227 (-) Transcript_75364:891-1571(-)
MPDELVQGAAIAKLHEDEEEGHKGTEGGAPRELKPRVLVLDDVWVVQALKGLHLADHIPQPGLVVPHWHLLHCVVTQPEVVKDMAAEENSAETARSQWPRLDEEARIVAGIQEACGQVSQGRSCCSLRLCAALRGDHGHFGFWHQQEGVAADSLGAGSTGNAVADGLQHVADLVHVNFDFQLPIHLGGGLPVLQTRSVHHVHKLLNVEIVQVHVAGLVVFRTLVLI